MSEVSGPFISSLEPNTVEQGSEVTICVRGTGFDNGTFALVDGFSPRTVFRGEHLLECSITRDVTQHAGSKTVKVHTAGGSLSNEVALVVTPSGTSTKPARRMLPAGFGKALVKSYLVSTRVDHAELSRREFKFMDLVSVAGDPVRFAVIIFVSDEPLVDLGSYSPDSGVVFGRAKHRDFEDMYEILRAEPRCFIEWSSDRDNKLTGFGLTNDSRP